MTPITIKYNSVDFQMDSSPDLALTPFPPPAGVNPSSGVQSKDAVISPEIPLSARLYIPKHTGKKLPLLIYFHGGGFVIDRRFTGLLQLLEPHHVGLNPTPS
ncbi:hypothetical protein R6Q59_033586 [Mikania micrantha]